MWRMRNPDVRERVRTMVDAVLIEPAADGDGRRLETTFNAARADGLAAAV